jgi:hypothetical protein
VKEIGIKHFLDEKARKRNKMFKQMKKFKEEEEKKQSNIAPIIGSPL